ncbi:Pol polyprotein [Folsomia candida]|uniref:Pol polyprotein n=1 Tax=Folsomia candida TaxID=158441 RepID=A0A226DA69_FOLCA|nr:Pol polyprotein [Folsomia candida]
MADIRPGDFYSCDLLGPFPESTKGNKMVIVLTDIVSRYVIVGALKDGTAESVGEFIMDEVICKKGSFKILLTDNGKCFISKLMEVLAQHLGFQQYFTNPQSPNINGLTERFNKTLAEMISHYIPNRNFTTWDQNLAAVCFAHNTSIQKSIQEKPYYLFWGQEPKLPQDGALQLPTKSLMADSLLYRLQIALERARENLEKAQAAQKARFDETVTENPFRVGDIVLYELEIRRKGEPSKLQPKRKGPYVIEAILEGSSCIIRDIEKSKPPEKVSIRRLLLFDRIHQEEEVEIVEDQSPLPEEANDDVVPDIDHPEPSLPTLHDDSGGDAQSPMLIKRRGRRGRKRLDKQKKEQKEESALKMPPVLTSTISKSNTTENAHMQFNPPPSELRRSARIKERKQAFMNCLGMQQFDLDSTALINLPSQTRVGFCCPKCYFSN